MGINVDFTDQLNTISLGTFYKYRLAIFSRKGAWRSIQWNKGGF